MSMGWDGVGMGWRGSLPINEGHHTGGAGSAWLLWYFRLVCPETVP